MVRVVLELRTCPTSAIIPVCNASLLKPAGADHQPALASINNDLETSDALSPSGGLCPGIVLMFCMMCDAWYPKRLCFVRNPLDAFLYIILDGVASEGGAV